MALKDIEKLKEKFEKDPNSKLFLPLAEEYRKEGMLDEAVDVLQNGIDRHAAYTSARVLLGKIYLEKGMLDEAKNEFESVVKTVPDNLFAYKKLAEIYRNTGEAELAIKAFKSILKLNPMDEETINSLRDVEAVVSPEKAVEEQLGSAASSVELRMPEEGAPAAYGDVHFGEELRIEAPDVTGEHSEDELGAFKDSLFGGEDNLGDALESASAGPDEPEKAGESSIAEAGSSASAEDLSFTDLDVLIGDVEIPSLGEPVAPATEAEQTIELLAEPPEVAEEHVSSSFDTPTDTINKGEDIADADRFVAEGKFFEAMGAYRKFLTADPNNKTALQRVEELRALLKLMGKDKEVLIAKLDAFLEGINKKRDEFFGRS